MRSMALNSGGVEARVLVKIGSGLVDQMMGQWFSPQRDLFPFG